MKVSYPRLQYESQKTGFRPEMLEKVFQLLNLLERFQEHPFLKERLALKGGTALNLFLFNVPRLSVDIDLNYIASSERAVMLEERPRVENALKAVCEREGMRVVRQPEAHAGGKWLLEYQSSVNEGGNLEVDLNYMYRVPLWTVDSCESYPIGSHQISNVQLLDVHEIAAGKLAALFSRHASRDLYDVHLLLDEADLEPKKLRLGFVIYGAMNRKDWRTVSLDDINMVGRNLDSELLPLLRAERIQNVEDVGQWEQKLVTECTHKLEALLPLSDTEMEFLDELLDRGQIVPSLLTSDCEMAERIQNHPLLRWKALNVKQYRGS